jgi:hypothetical protein
MMLSGSSDALSEACDQRDVDQARRKDAVRAGVGKRACSLNRLNHDGTVMMFGRSLEEDICPSIYEEAEIGGIGHLPSASDASRLVGCLPQPSVCRKTILQVAANSFRVDCETDSLGDHFRQVAVAALQIDCHRQIRRVHNPTQVVDRQAEWEQFAIGEAICISH